MASLKTPMLAGALVIAAAFSTVSPALDVHCPPDPGDVQIDGDVLVAAPCELDGTDVKGNVRLFAGGSLLADGADVRGNVDARTADFVILLESVVDGNVQLDSTVGDLSRIVLSEIDGNVQLTGNRSRLEIQNNRVDGNLQADGNMGGILIADNLIDGNLSCRRNEPAPVGSDNRVSGKEQDQCANLSFDGAAPSVDGGAEETDDLGEPSGGLVLNPQPSGGGSAIGPLDAVLMGLLLVGLRLARRRSGTR